MTPRSFALASAARTRVALELAGWRVILRSFVFFKATIKRRISVAREFATRLNLRGSLFGRAGGALEMKIYVDDIASETTKRGNISRERGEV